MLARQVQFNYEPIAGAVRVDGVYVSVGVWTMLNCAKTTTESARTSIRVSVTFSGVKV